MHISLEQFQGPLDLLLALIEKNKLDISEISLAQVTDQYVSAVDQGARFDLKNLIYFLEIASRLIFLKSRLLLPYLNPEDTDEDDEQLVQTLRRYKHYQTAASTLLGMWNRKTFFCKERGFLRDVFTCKPCGEFPLPNAILFKETMERLIQKTAVSLIHTGTLKRVFTIKEKINAILRILKKSRTLLFGELFHDRHSRRDFIITFIALLELCKKNQIYMNQKIAFSEIHIHGYSITT